jgi:hypothetical protein
MRRLACALFAGLLLASVAGSAAAAGPAIPGLLPANAHPHGLSMVDLSTAWNAWAWSAPEASSPLLAGRCEQSPNDPKIWFLPASIGVPPEATATCEVPRGAFLVLVVGGTICSAVAGDGNTAEELRACAEDEANQPSYAEVTFKGQTVSGLDDYFVTSRPFTLPADNLLGPDPGLSVARMIMMVVAPLGPGTHTLRAYDEFEAFDFFAGITFTIVVH